MPRILFLVLNFLWFFLMTLDSFYFYQISMPLFSVSSVLLAVLLIILQKVILKRYHILPFKILLFIFLLSLFTSLSNTEYFYVKRLPLFVLLVPHIIYSCFVLTEKKKLMVLVIKSVLIIHLFFFFFQFITFYVTGNFIDYLEPITGEVQRALGGSYSFGSSGLKLIRATGLYNEPGTYSTFMFITFLIYRSLYSDVNNTDKLKLFDLILIISILLTFSVFGFVFTAIFSLHYFVNEKFSNKIKIAFAMIPFAYISINNYLIERFQNQSGGDTGLGFREEGINVFIDHVKNDVFHLIFGYSYFVDINKLFGTQFAFNDISLLFTTITTLGLLGFCLFLLITFNRFKKEYLLIIIVCLSKLSLTTIFIWFAIGFIYGRPLRHE